jgi:hypothetical protein
VRKPSVKTPTRADADCNNVGAPASGRGELMLDVLHYGAGDTAEVDGDFVQVVSEFGGTPLHYQSGDILYVNTATSTWAENSQASVQSADLCVFVIVRALGSITWTTEFREVVTSGKPFVMLSLDSTYNRYLDLAQAARHDTDPATVADDRVLLETLAAVERDHQVTIVPFPEGGSRRYSAASLRTPTRCRSNCWRHRTPAASSGPCSPTPSRWPPTTWSGRPTSLSTRWRRRGARTQAILALALRLAATEEVTVALLGSPEQGVQRLAFARLPDLYVERPPGRDFLTAVIEIANTTDVGVTRRFLPILFEMDLTTALAALTALNPSDIGLRRRLTEQLELHEDRIRDSDWFPQRSASRSEHRPAPTTRTGRSDSSSHRKAHE